MSDPKYGAITAELKDIPADEPVFLIRAQDTLSVTTLIAYRAFVNFTGGSPEILASLDDTIARFEKWQETNYVKIPD